MCYSLKDANRVRECDLGDCAPGTQYRTPEGDSVLVCDTLNNETHTTTVNLRTGLISMVPSTVKLGRDRSGRLYASRFLNPTPEQQARKEAEIKDIMDLLP